MRHYNISVVGKVQGVFFRKHINEVAKELGIVGLVKNEKDGSVSIEVEADGKILHKFLIECHKGSEESDVTNMYIEQDDLKDFKEFKIV